MVPSDGINIRNGRPGDMSDVMRLIRELAAFERSPESVTLTEEELLQDGFGDNPAYGIIVAEKAGQTVGLAIYYEKYSTWQGRCLFLEDIIVTEKERGNGIGRRLFSRVIAEARSRNSARMEWQVLDWNKPAIGFYRTFDAELDPEWVNGKLTRTQIQTFCNG